MSAKAISRRSRIANSVKLPVSGRGKMLRSSSSRGLCAAPMRSMPSSPATIMTRSSPPIRCLMLFNICSKTGCTSDGAPAMTFRMSAVAAWRSSAARSRFFSLAVSDSGLSAGRSPDFGLRDLGRGDGLAVDCGFREGLLRLDAFARFAGFRARVAMAIPHESLTNPGADVQTASNVVLTR